MEFLKILPIIIVVAAAIIIPFIIDKRQKKRIYESKTSEETDRLIRTLTPSLIAGRPMRTPDEQGIIVYLKLNGEKIPLSVGTRHSSEIIVKLGGEDITHRINGKRLYAALEKMIQANTNDDLLKIIATDDSWGQPQPIGCFDVATDCLKRK